MNQTTVTQTEKTASVFILGTVSLAGGYKLGKGLMPINISDTAKLYFIEEKNTGTCTINVKMCREVTAMLELCFIF